MPTGCPKSNGNITLSLAKGLGGSFALVFLGGAQAALPMGGGCTLNVAPLIGPVVGPIALTAGGPGQGTFSLPATCTSRTTSTWEGIVPFITL